MQVNILTDFAKEFFMTMKLFEVLSKLRTEDEFRAFFEDLCTYAEIEKLSLIHI